jgi:hypothetical protein
MINTYRGVGVNWGVYSTIQYVVGAFQTRDNSYSSNSETITDGGNTTVSKVYWDFKEEASFTYVATQPFIAGNAGVMLPFVGYFVTVTDLNYPAISGQWLVDSISVNGSNTTATRVSLRLSRYPFLNSSIRSNP